MIGKYRLTRTLGQGSYGRVKLAIDDDTRKKYAVKIIDKDMLNDSLSRKLNNEVYALRKLQGHPNIV